MPDLKLVTLDTIAAGAAPELFERALAEILENIKDPNTPAETKRSISLTFEFSPREDRNGGRNEGEVVVKCQSKLAAPTPAVGHMFISREKGAVVAYTNDFRQEDLLEQIDTKTGEVLPINKSARA